QNLANAVGCDSTITLNLTINQPTTSSITTTTCSAYTLNGTTYTSSGSYTQNLTNAMGCDSIITLNLTVNQAAFSTQSLTVCAGQSVTVGANTYTATGTYTDVLTTVNG